MENKFFIRLRYLFNKKAFQELIDASDAKNELEETEARLKEARDRINVLEDKIYTMYNDIEDEKFKTWTSELKFRLMLNSDFASALKNKKYNKAYDIAKPYIDEEGFNLYRQAEEHTNINVYSHFPAEDNRGYFENSNGFELLRYLEVAAFGEIEWEQLSGGYEKASKMSLDTETPEYKRYRNEICAKVLEKKLGISLIEPVVAMAV